mgnify:CR=1 FL=1
MSSNIYTAGLRNVGSYQVSGHPYLSGSTTSASIGAAANGYFAFPYVTKSITIDNNDASDACMISFAPFLDADLSAYGFTTGNDVSGSGNWLYLAAGDSMTLDVKCKEIFVTPHSANAVEVQVYAELTGIPTTRMYSFNGLRGITQ